MIFVLTGNGKGKTTSAVGMGVRAAGAGLKVLMVQFLKAGDSSEVNVIKKIKDFKIKNFGRPGFGPYSKKDSQLAKSGFLFAKKAAFSKKCDLLILDEISLALKFKLIPLGAMLTFLEKYRSELDIVLTGRYCPEEITKMSDLATEFREIKHYYKKGIKARKGIEC